MRILDKDHATYRKGMMISEMTAFATGVHATQLTTNGTPMIVHLMNVCHYIPRDDEELQCIAMGHELINSSEYIYTKDLIDMGMSDRVIIGVYTLAARRNELEPDYLNRVIKNTDTLRVAQLCYRDKYFNTEPRSVEATRLSNIIVQLNQEMENATLLRLPSSATRFGRNQYVGCSTLPGDRIRRNSRRG